MVKRKSSEGQEQDRHRGIPLPIQIFLWRQTSAFLRPKLGKQYEASCVSFERVLVENKLHGLSPALSEAIQSISRWELVQAALPHVLHCTATLLSNRNKLGHQDKLGVAETKLLHTLHWMLLEAPQDCSYDRFGGDRSSSWGGGSGAFIHHENQGSPVHSRQSNPNEEDDNNRRKFLQNSMATVELFVFLFAPLAHRIKESDLTFRLASGLVIWQPMWEYRHPEVPAFTALVKPIRNIITAKRSSPCNSQNQASDSPKLDIGHTQGFDVVSELAQTDSLSPRATVSSCQRANSFDGCTSSQTSQERGPPFPRTSLVIPPCQKSRYATYFDVAVLRCLLQPHWSEEGTQWSLMYYLHRLKHMLEEKPEKSPEPVEPPLPRPRSSSMVAAAPSLVNTHKTQDLKQTMKKEQCEVKLLVTASMPGTKTLVVHGQNECDIPTQLPVHEDTQFEALLKECLEFFNIADSQSANYFLMDKRWNLIHYNKTYVRDIYPFRRSVSPQLNLIHMPPEKGQELIQKQVFTRKLEEVGRVLFLISLTQKIPTAHKQSHVSMLQEDLLRLPSFPRSAIDAEFSLFNDPQAGKELFGLDTLQKSLWIKLLEEMFLGMPSEFPWGDEIMLFLNVFNGALILHPEDSSLLRQYAATVINTAVHFNHLFSLSGYQWILPTMLQVYADYESNPQLRQAIEFACRQFYILHRKPFVLQLFASVAPLLEFPDGANSGSPSKGVSAQCLFDLLQSLEGDTADILDILELVKAERPLKSLDFCYGNEDMAFSISECIKLCVTVVAYAPESFRSLQMLMVLEALVPCYLQKLKRQTSQLETVSAAREEIAATAALATSLQALLYSVEALTRPMTAPQMSRGDQGHKGATTANHTMSAGVNLRDNLHLLEEGQGLPREELDERIAREEFRRPRESLLNICTEFYKHCGPRLKILQNLAGEPRVTSLELLDVKSHMRLAEIAHSLLKLAPYDTQTMESRGLKRYIMEMLPITDWTAEAVRPALILILKRLDRMFNKIHKMPTLRRQVEWEPASNLIEGVCLTLQRQPIISFLPHLRSLINVCVNLVMGVVGPSSVADGLPLLHLSPYLSPPLPFSTAVVRLVALQIQALKEDFPLCHVISPFTNQERREGMLLNLLIPFVLTVGSGSKDSPWLELPEVFLLLQTVINILLPPRIISTSRSKNFMLESSPAHCSTPGDAGKDLRREGLAESTSQAAYLALKVILVCFERQLGSQWYRLSLQVKEMALRKVGGLALWDFLDFIVRTRIPIFVLLRPFIQCKLLAQPAETQDELSARQHIADQLERRFIPRPLCKSSLINEFNSELKILKEAVHSGSAYQGKTSISTVGTSTSAYRLSLATMSRSNTGTGTVWEQDSEHSQQASQDTLSRTDEEEENDSVSIPSVVSEQDAYLMSAIGRRRFSSNTSSMSVPQAEGSMLPSQSEPNVLDDSHGRDGEMSLSRVASVQSEPGQQNLLIQQPLGRKRGLRQLRRPLLSRQKTQTEPRSRHGARLSTTRRSVQPRTKQIVDQKRSVTFTESQPQPSTSHAEVPPTTPRPGCSPAPSFKQVSSENPVLTSSPSITVVDFHSQDDSQVTPQERGPLPGERRHGAQQYCSSPSSAQLPVLPSFRY
ncbi:hypothetical protein FKM82_016071 [Ascaphus truei]